MNKLKKILFNLRAIFKRPPEKLKPDFEEIDEEKTSEQLSKQEAKTSKGAMEYDEEFQDLVDRVDENYKEGEEAIENIDLDQKSEEEKGEAYKKGEEMGKEAAEPILEYVRNIDTGNAKRYAETAAKIRDLDSIDYWDDHHLGASGKAKYLIMEFGSFYWLHKNKSSEEIYSEWTRKEGKADRLKAEEDDLNKVYEVLSNYERDMRNNPEDYEEDLNKAELFYEGGKLITKLEEQNKINSEERIAAFETLKEKIKKGQISTIDEETIAQIIREQETIEVAQRDVE